MTVDGKEYDLKTSTFTDKSNSRGKRTAVSTGMGAGVGAVIGALAGGGKGAATSARAPVQAQERAAQRLQASAMSRFPLRPRSTSNYLSPSPYKPRSANTRPGKFCDDKALTSNEPEVRAFSHFTLVNGVAARARLAVSDTESRGRARA